MKLPPVELETFATAPIIIVAPELTLAPTMLTSVKPATGEELALVQTAPPATPQSSYSRASPVVDRGDQEDASSIPLTHGLVEPSPKEKLALALPSPMLVELAISRHQPEGSIFPSASHDDVATNNNDVATCPYATDRRNEQSPFIVEPMFSFANNGIEGRDSGSQLDAGKPFISLHGHCVNWKTRKKRRSTATVSARTAAAEEGVISMLSLSKQQEAATVEKLLISKPSQSLLSFQEAPPATVITATNITGTSSFEKLQPNWKYRKRRGEDHGVARSRGFVQGCIGPTMGGLIGALLYGVNPLSSEFDSLGGGTANAPFDSFKYGVKMNVTTEKKPTVDVGVKRFKQQMSKDNNANEVLHMWRDINGQCGKHVQESMEIEGRGARGMLVLCIKRACNIYAMGVPFQCFDPEPGSVPPLLHLKLVPRRAPAELRASWVLRLVSLKVAMAGLGRELVD
ncbi:unnamed protein product [Linum tenue]|uniref:Uncharacterized protein n=1 Tax=Linum tenue TaxID=586396 RepID=A0AAV0RTT9_9ROSI|nr:unnamed protein product [Linum tenue]